MKLIFTKRAVKQISEIIDYIAERSPQGAISVRARIQATAALLVEQPFMGQASNVIGVRRLIVSPYPYIIIYRITADAIFIQRVRHTSRDPSRIPGRA